MDDFIQGLSGLFQKAYQQGIADGQKQPLVEHRLLERKDLAKTFGISRDALDDYYLTRPDFPFITQGGRKKYYAPTIHQWLLDHQETRK